jgi:hypothetical protein
MFRPASGQGELSPGGRALWIRLKNAGRMLSGTSMRPPFRDPFVDALAAELSTLHGQAPVFFLYLAYPCRNGAGWNSDGATSGR